MLNVLGRIADSQAAALFIVRAISRQKTVPTIEILCAGIGALL